MCKLCEDRRLRQACHDLGESAFAILDKAEGGLHIQGMPSSTGTVKVLMVVEIDESHAEAVEEAITPYLEETALIAGGGSRDAHRGRPGKA